MNLAGGVCDAPYLKANVHFFLIQFQRGVNTINCCQAEVMRLRLKKNFDGLDSFHAWSMKEGI